MCVYVINAKKNPYIPTTHGVIICKRDTKEKKGYHSYIKFINLFKLSYHSNQECANRVMCVCMFLSVFCLFSSLTIESRQSLNHLSNGSRWCRIFNKKKNWKKKIVARIIECLFFEQEKKNR